MFRAESCTAILAAQNVDAKERKNPAFDPSLRSRHGEVHAVTLRAGDVVIHKIWVRGWGTTLVTPTLLQARGNVVIRGVDAESREVELRGDTIYMFLNTADATIRGNVRVTGIYEGRQPRLPVTGPDVIKK